MLLTWPFHGAPSLAQLVLSGRRLPPIVPTTPLAAPGTTKTSMDHPSRGSTQLFRRDLSAGEHQAVLNNPRVHTGKGYYTKK
jgi:hypothetical protein